jgi:rhodanese-related sulfurtransferase
MYVYLSIAVVLVVIFYNFFGGDGGVQRISNKQLFDILHGPAENRSRYQVVDVREAYELESLSLTKFGVLHFPLSDKSRWNVAHLDRSLPTICICARGRRSISGAQHLSK